MQFDAMAVPVQLCKRNSQTLALESLRLRRTTLAYGLKSTAFHGVLPGPASRLFYTEYYPAVSTRRRYATM
jgi:hypothetical protein